MTCGGRIEANLLQFSAFRVPSGCEISLSLASARDLHRSGGERESYWTHGHCGGSSCSAVQGRPLTTMSWATGLLPEWQRRLLGNWRRTSSCRALVEFTKDCVECCQLVGVPSFMHAEVSVSEDSLYGSRYAVPAPLSLKAISRLMGAVRWDACRACHLNRSGTALLLCSCVSGPLR